MIKGLFDKAKEVTGDLVSTAAVKTMECGQAIEQASHQYLENRSATPEDWGQVGYDAYCMSTGGVSLVSGDTLPQWDQLPLEIRGAWINVAKVLRGDK